MICHIIRRTLSIIPILLDTVFFIIGIMSLTPRSPGLAILGPDAPVKAVEELNEKLGYDQQYLEVI